MKLSKFIKKFYSLILSIYHPISILGVAYKKNENYDAAIACYKAAIEIDPKLDYLYINLANALKTIHCFKEAIDNYQQALALNPTSASAYSGLGYAQYSLGDYIAAEKILIKQLI